MTMKKLILPLLCLLLLGGCGKADEGRELSTPDGSIHGQYIGEELDGLPEGQGVFTSENGWVYEGGFTGGAFGVGRVSDYPAPAYNGVYTGAVEALVPQGEGQLLREDGRFTGSFDKGAPFTGEAENFPCSVSFGGAEVSGFYTGSLTAGLPEGEGSFRAEGARSLSYEGGFAAGLPKGEGALSDDGFMLAGQRGLYEGSVVDGIPHGEGSYRGRSAENIDFSYSGQWKDGLFDGEGELRCDSALYYDRIGHFSKGEFDPTSAELLAALGSREPLFEVSDTTLAYIGEYSELLDAEREIPNYMQSDYRFLWDQTLSYARYIEKPADFQESWLLFYNYLPLRSYEVDSFGKDNRCTVILAASTVHKEPAVFYVFGDCSELLNKTYITVYGIPMGMTHYTNANGEQVEAVAVLLGAAGGY